jgi:hypothetical protein
MWILFRTSKKRVWKSSKNKYKWICFYIITIYK